MTDTHLTDIEKEINCLKEKLLDQRNERRWEAALAAMQSQYAWECYAKTEHDFKTICWDLANDWVAEADRRESGDE